ncbi:uncharacterized protein [Arachis hypogaea]|uniref:uncharacterized protein n=1 Tax=Arachis hypogaea TaxID=3818 RepID=UPI003B218F84
MQSPRNKKEVQQLTGWLAALSRFLPAAAEKSYHFFNTLKKSDRFNWTEKCEEAFKKFKNTLGSPPILKKPERGKPLHLFLSISANAISSVLVIDNDKEQHPVYFLGGCGIISKDTEIIVRTNQPLRQILAKPDLAERLTKWSIELSEFDISYQSRGSPKAQALADFISEFTNAVEPESWELYVDGASNDNGCGAGIPLRDKKGVYAEQSIKFMFQATNNQAEYEALLSGLKLAKEIQVPNLQVYCDSLLVVQQDFKKKLTEAKGRWAELIPEILWSYNTTPQSTTKESPFRLVYGAECMIPLELGQGSTRTEHFNEDNNKQARCAELDVIGEECHLTELRQRSMQLAMKRQYDKKFR